MKYSITFGDCGGLAEIICYSAQEAARKMDFAVLEQLRARKIENVDELIQWGQVARRMKVLRRLLKDDALTKQFVVMGIAISPDEVAKC